MTRGNASQRPYRTGCCRPPASGRLCPQGPSTRNERANSPSPSPKRRPYSSRASSLLRWHGDAGYRGIVGEGTLVQTQTTMEVTEMEKQICTLLHALLWLLCLGLSAQAQSSVCDNSPQPQGKPDHRRQVFTSREWNASNFASPKDLEWFREARFGGMISFGLSRGQEISWGYCHTRKPPDQGRDPSRTRSGHSGRRR